MLSTTTCSPTNTGQQWTLDHHTLGLTVPGTKQTACVDVGGCGRTAGSAVHLFSGPDGWVCGVGDGHATSDCGYKNEEWTVVKWDQQHQGIVSTLSGLCTALSLTRALSLFLAHSPCTLSKQPFLVYYWLEARIGVC
jgi:hypothetical protein